MLNEDAKKVVGPRMKTENLSIPLAKLRNNAGGSQASCHRVVHLLSHGKEHNGETHRCWRYIFLFQIPVFLLMSKITLGKLYLYSLCFDFTIYKTGVKIIAKD